MKPDRAREKTRGPLRNDQETITKEKQTGKETVWVLGPASGCPRIKERQHWAVGIDLFPVFHFIPQLVSNKRRTQTYSTPFLLSEKTNNRSKWLSLSILNMYGVTAVSVCLRVCARAVKREQDCPVAQTVSHVAQESWQSYSRPTHTAGICMRDVSSRE